MSEAYAPIYSILITPSSLERLSYNKFKILKEKISILIY